ncbi:MAG TPA: histidinol-phosphate aminotransferase family protein [Dehalococcoidia bacterium]|nr:histidinol-phosphate aminotransferase family protein [Dehalococcoidia bacterium]
MLQPRPDIDRLTYCSHGGINYEELESLGISPHTVLDFSVCCNPFGPPPGVKEALVEVPLDRYPDSEAGELKQLLAKKLNITPNNLLIGSGSTELIRLITIAYLDRGDTVLIPQPTYGEYEIACCLSGAQVLKQPWLGDPDFRLDTAEIIRLIENHRPKGVFLCSPNNPTGQYMTKQQFENIMSAAKDCLIILDEAYIAFTEDAWSSIDLIKQGNLVILRSMTKDYALAGLRLGYAIADEPIISILKRIRPPWNVNIMAQKAGIIVLNAEGYLEECHAKIRELKRFLVKELANLGLSPLASQTNFFLVRVGSATKFRRTLLNKGILVRDCTSFGLPQHIRLAPRTLPDCKTLVTAIREIGVLSHAC